MAHLELPSVWRTMGVDESIGASQIGRGGAIDRAQLAKNSKEPSIESDAQRPSGAGERDVTPAESTAASKNPPSNNAQDSDRAANNEVANDPPDWSMVPFAVACPRCGRDVHGRSEPMCPDCALPLDWSVLAPVEELTCPKCEYHLFGLTTERCPECGGAFSWEEVIDGFRRRQRPLFEFRWRQAPVRWFFRAVWHSFRPWKLWRTVDIYDPTAPRGLAVLAAFALLFSVAVPLLLAYPTHWLLTWLTNLSTAPTSRWMRWQCAPWPSSWRFGHVFGQTLLGTTISLAWLFGALGTLMLLRQSMALCRVRNGHVFRVCVYSLIPLACCPAIAFALTAVMDTTRGLLAINPSSSPLKDAVGQTLVGLERMYGLPILILVLLALCTFSMAMGYRYYIRMRHSWAVALASQAIGGILALIASVWAIRLF